jgi:two-component system, sensor histidine kinase
MEQLLLLALAVWGLYGIVNAVQGRAISALIDLTEVLAIVALLLLGRAFGTDQFRLKWLPHLMLGTAAAGLTAISVVSGQADAYGQFYLLCMPLFASVALSRRAVVAWTAVTLFLLAGIHASDRVWPVEAEYIATGWELAGGVAVLCITVASFGWLLRLAWDEKIVAAQAATRAKAAFLAQMTHELRTPLAGVLGLTRSLLDDDPLPRQRDKLTTIDQCGTTLLALLEDMLHTSAGEAQHAPLLEKPYVPVDAARAVVDLLRTRADEAGRSLRLQGEAPATIGDRARVQQILLNLVANALSHGQGEVVGDVALEARKLVFRVRDQGPGIQDIERALRAFGASGESSGVGLGLPISKLLAERMEGELSIQATPSVVTLALPHRETSPPTQDLAPARVLVVEDNDVNRLVVTEALNRLGYEPQTCTTGRAAVTRAGQFDVILMDLQLPDMDGREATRAIRADGHSAWIVAITANIVGDEQTRCRDAGMDDFLGKPFQQHELRDALARFTENRGARA